MLEGSVEGNHYHVVYMDTESSELVAGDAEVYAQIGRRSGEVQIRGESVVNLLIPIASGLLETVEGLLEFEDAVRAIFKAWNLAHEDLFGERCVEVCANDIDLMEIETEIGGVRYKSTKGFELHDRSMCSGEILVWNL